jgi:hypothetical protein
MVLIEPAKKPTARTRSASGTDMCWHRRLAAVPDEKPPLDRALDLFVYAPVGMALYVRDMFPSMMGIFVSRGKREVKSHLPGYDAPTPPAPPVPMPDVADIRRKVGDSIGLARGVAGGGIGLARDVTGSALQGLMSFRNGVPQTEAAEEATTWRPDPDAPPSSAFTAPGSAPVADRAAAAEETAASPAAPQVEELPIPDYDELSASQVIERLEGLDADSLEAIRAYEASHRGRNTILGKIAQLS